LRLSLFLLGGRNPDHPPDFQEELLFRERFPALLPSRTLLQINELNFLFG